MAAPQRFLNYPKACEGPKKPFERKQNHNPPLRGWRLVIASNIVAGSSYVAHFFWRNALFGTVKDIPELAEYASRFDPVVIPLVSDDDVAAAGSGQVQIEPALHERQAPDLAGRYLSAADYHALYKSGEWTPSGVVEGLLPAIRRDQDPPAKYASAWVHSDVDRVRAAAAASTQRYAAGKPRGLLDGVLISVKDDIDVEGYISHNGMQYNPAVPWFSPAKETVWPVQKLEDAGAIVVGKNVMHELGSDPCGCNPRWGTPVNWYNSSYYPGGSSSGGGSAVGAGLVPIALGTDAGGSVRIPAAFNGVYGLKPTHHRTHRMPSTVVDIGPLAATVSDLVVAYRIMSQRNPEDSTQGQFATSIPPSPSAKKVIGMFRDWNDLASPEVTEVCQKAIHYLTEKRGYEIVDIQIPYLREGQLAHSASCLLEMADKARTRTPNPADFLSIVNNCNKTLLSIGMQTPGVDVVKYGQLRELIMQHLAFLFQKHRGLLIVTPTVGLPGWKKTPGDEAYGFSDGNTSIRVMKYIWLSNNSGCPSVTAPVGYLEPEQGEGKLPVSLMAMGEWGAEEQLFAWARDTEAYLNEELPGGRHRPKEWADVLAMAKEATHVKEAKEE